MHASQYFSDTESDTIPVNAYCVVCVSIPEHKVVCRLKSHAVSGLDRGAAICVMRSLRHCRILSDSTQLDKAACVLGHVTVCCACDESAM